MKYVLIIIIGVLLYQSPNARNFTAQQLTNLADLIDTNPSQFPDLFHTHE